jgi:hypothetical protein
MYHLELRKFPKRVQRYNMNGQQIGAVLLPWVQDQVVDLGEQRWKPHESEITVLEGPEVPTADTSLGRGWRRAEKEGRDVTEQVLAEARAHVGEAGTRGPAQAASVVAPAAAAVIGAAGSQETALAMQLGSLLGPDAARLMDAWRSVRAREPALAPSEALAVAERELREE